MQAICECCGKTFDGQYKGSVKKGTAIPAKYCSVECRIKGQTDAPVNCAYCGKLFIGHWRGYNPDGTTKKSTYCSKECQNKANAKPFYTCQYCGKQFQSANSHPKKFCSYDCAHGESRERMAKKQAERDAILSSKVCKFCGKTFTAKYTSEEYCSQDCRRLSLNKSCRDRYVKKGKTQQNYQKVCQICGAEYVAHGVNSKYCSDRCRRIFGYNNYKPHKRRDLAALIKRDGLKCKLCNEEIDMHRLGLFGVSVDHIVPRSKGGTDELPNLRLAHCICNALRGADEEKNEIDLEELEKYKAREVEG